MKNKKFVILSKENRQRIIVRCGIVMAMVGSVACIFVQYNKSKQPQIDNEIVTIKQYTGHKLTRTNVEKVTESDVAGMLEKIRVAQADYWGVDVEKVEFTDEMVQYITDGQCNNEEDLKEQLRESLEHTNQVAADEEALYNIRMKIVEGMEIHQYDQTLLNASIESVRNEYKAEAEELGLTLDEYVMLSNELEAEEDVDKAIEEQAKLFLRNEIMYKQIATNEGFLVTDEMIEQERQRRVQEWEMTYEEVLENYPKESLEKWLIDEYVESFLLAHSIIR